MDDCAAARRVAKATLGTTEPGHMPAGDAVEAALNHLMRCRRCRDEMPAEERGRFVSAAVLGRD